MLTQYESTFTIVGGAPGDDDAGDDAAGVGLLRQVVRRVMDELQAAAGEAVPDLEQGATAGAGYAAISAERPYPGRPELAVRLEARFCTADDGDGVAAQIHTRFISADGSDPPNLRAGPPRLLRAIAEQFQCRNGITPISNAATRVTAADAAAFTSDHILNPGRTLPILVISEDGQGRTAIVPEWAQEYLTGVAQVAVFDVNGPPSPASPCFNGFVRMYWPPQLVPPRNARLPGFYPMAQAAALSRYELQQACLTYALDNDFDRRFSQVHIDVVLERNRQLEAERQQRSATPAAASSGDGDVAELHREIRRAQLRGNEANRKLEIANDAIARLQQDLAAAEERNEYLAASSSSESPDGEPEDGADEPRDSARRRRVTNRELREREATIARLNEANQSLRQQITRRRQADRTGGAGVGIPLTGDPVDRVTALNHAVNIYRDRMRHFIIANLRQEFGGDLTDRLTGGIVEMAWHRTRELAASDPKAFIDVDVFEDIVVAYPDCFAIPDLPRKLREIKHIRNRAAHPPPQGIDYASMQDGLRTISEAMAAIGAAPAGGAVTDLMQLMQQRRAV